MTCLDFPDNETGAFWVGTEEGGVYVVDRFDRAGQKSGINAREIYKSHDAPVTSVDFHPLKGPIDFSDLFLSTSVDWTVKLWRARPGSRPSTGVSTVGSASGQTANVPPIYSFEEANDYVYDARWHPSHPAVFGSVSGDGQFEIWNLNADTEVSQLSASRHCDSPADQPPSTIRCPSRALRWAMVERSTNWHGKNEMGGMPLWEPAMACYISTTLDQTWQIQRKTNGTISSEQSRRSSRRDKQIRCPPCRFLEFTIGLQIDRLRHLCIFVATLDNINDR